LKKAAGLDVLERARYRDAGKGRGGRPSCCRRRGKAGWFWYIPLHDDIVSVGVVAAKRLSLWSSPARSRELARHLRRGGRPAAPGSAPPACRGTRRGATSSGAQKGVQLQVGPRRRGTGGSSWGERVSGSWDPLYSSGVLLALTSGGDGGGRGRGTRWPPETCPRPVSGCGRPRTSRAMEADGGGPRVRVLRRALTSAGFIRRQPGTRRGWSPTC